MADAVRSRMNADFTVRKAAFVRSLRAKVYDRNPDYVPRAEPPDGLAGGRVVKLVDLFGPERLLIGEVGGVHINDGCLVDGRLDPMRYNPAARMGYHDYTFVRELRELRRPKDPAPE